MDARLHAFRVEMRDKRLGLCRLREGKNRERCACGEVVDRADARRLIDTEGCRPARNEVIGVRFANGERRGRQLLQQRVVRDIQRCADFFTDHLHEGVKAGGRDVRASERDLFALFQHVDRAGAHLVLVGVVGDIPVRRSVRIVIVPVARLVHRDLRRIGLRLDPCGKEALDQRGHQLTLGVPADIQQAFDDRRQEADAPVLVRAF